jgi:chromate transporter
MRPPALSYWQLFLRFLWFGCHAWGGPIAQIAMLRRELVEKESWISSDHFNRLLAVMQVLPGPEAHEMCVHLGVRAKGRWGGLLAGLGFMLPGFLLILALSWLYVRIDLTGGVYGAILLGIQITVIALIVRAVHRIGEHVLRRAGLWIIALLCAAGVMFDIPFWLMLPAAGLVNALIDMNRRALAVAILVLASVLAYWLPTHGASTDRVLHDVPTIALLFLAGLKAGLLTFGGAYTAIPFVREDAVGRGWMSDAQFLDGLALSGVLPAPLIIFTTFVGYLTGGPAGAVAITAGVFLPAFSFSIVFYDRLEKILDNQKLHAFLDGVSAGVVGIIVATAIDLVQTTAVRVAPGMGLLIFLASLAILYRWKSQFNLIATIAVGGLVGLVWHVVFRYVN